MTIEKYKEIINDTKKKLDLIQSKYENLLNDIKSFHEKLKPNNTSLDELKKLDEFIEKRMDLELVISWFEIDIELLNHRFNYLIEKGLKSDEELYNCEKK